MKHKAPWPHLQVYNGPKLKGADYENLSVSEFVYGFLRQMKHKHFVKYREEMLEYLEEVMEDASEE